MGGLFQPIIEQSLTLLSSAASENQIARSSLTYTNKLNKNVAETAGNLQTSTQNPSRVPAWLHIFPEGRVYQHSNLQMRYFHWGISRFILELPTPPIILPIFHSGMQGVMHESRTFPRFVPRAGNKISIVIGESVPLETWADARQRWREIKDECEAIGGEDGERLLREGEEAVQLRIRVAMMVREEVEKVRVRSGYPPGDPASGLAETYRSMYQMRKVTQGADVWEKEE